MEAQEIRNKRRFISLQIFYVFVIYSTNITLKLPTLLMISAPADGFLAIHPCPHTRVDPGTCCAHVNNGRNEKREKKCKVFNLFVENYYKSLNIYVRQCPAVSGLLKIMIG